MTNISPTASSSPGRIDAAATARSASASGPAGLAADERSHGAAEIKAEPARRGDDRVEVSDLARFLSTLNTLPEVRAEKVERVKAELAAGSYETPEKVDLAVDALFADLEELG